MQQRRRVPQDIVARVLIRSKRRCCLCVHLHHDESIKKGQIAHLNGDRSDNREDNLAFLCFVHHDEYDTRSSQSKGITKDEVEHYRNLLYERDTDKTFDNSALDRSRDDEVIWIKFRCEDGHESWQQLWEFKAFHEWLTDRTDLSEGMAIWGVCPIHGHGTDGSIMEIKVRET